MTRTPAARMSWLGLLLSEAPEKDYDALRRRALRAATDDAERATVEAEAAAADRLRGQLAEHRRRLAELAALNDLGVRLTALRDLDALLQEVVTQARRLLDVDVAYLALAEPDRALTIHVTDGSIGPHLRGIRLAPHAGLAGLVLDTGEPVSSHDYLADRQLRHMEEADRVAAGEGLRTITGVPLRLHGEVIGVLMTAQRDVRPPTPNDLSLLASLAALAAVAIENARLFTERTDAVQALAGANEDLRRAADSVTRAVTLHERLMDVAVRGGGVSQVIAALSEVVAGRVVFVDAAGGVLAAAEDGQPAPVADVASAATAVTVPVLTRDADYGAIEVHSDQPPDDATLRLLERSAITIALLQAVQRTVAEAERRSVDEFLEQLVSRRLVAGDAVLRQAASVGVQLDRAYIVVVAGAEESATDQALRWARQLSDAHGGVCGMVSGDVVALVGDDVDLDALCAQRVSAATAGVAGPAVGLSGLATAYDEARACLSALFALGQVHRVGAAADLGPFRFLLSAAGRDDALRFVERTIGVLLEHDARRGTALTGTARQYLALGQRHAEVARALGIHPNTLYQRLARLDKVLGSGWCHQSRSLDIQLALRIDELIGSRERSVS